MKRLFLIVMVGFLFYSLQAGPRIVRLNCPHLGEHVAIDPSFGPIKYNCIHQVNGAFQFCLFLERNRGKTTPIYIRISIDDVENDTIPISDFGINIDGNLIKYNKWYEPSNMPIGLDEFELKVEVLQQNLQGDLVTYTGSHFHIVSNDNSSSNNPAVFTTNIKVCPHNIDPALINTIQSCNVAYYKTKIEEIDKISINKIINDGSINIYPNPFNDFININMLTNSSKFIDINLYDARGKLVVKINSEATNYDTFRERISTSSLPMGLYICEIITKDERFDFKLLKSN